MRADSKRTHAESEAAFDETSGASGTTSAGHKGNTDASHTSTATDDGTAEQIFTGYLSDTYDDRDEECDDRRDDDSSEYEHDGDDIQDECNDVPTQSYGLRRQQPSSFTTTASSPLNAVSDPSSSSLPAVAMHPFFHLPAIRSLPPRKRRKLDVPARMTRELARLERLKKKKMALEDLGRVMRSKKTTWEGGGSEGLQARRMRAVQSCLFMVAEKGRGMMEASKAAAEAQRFKGDWNPARLVRLWTRAWVDEREMPESKKGAHAKAYTLLSNPTIAAILRSFLRTKKWAMDPQKLAEFTKNTMVPAEAKKYAERIVNEEMPRGLKKYLEVELFPRIHMKPGKGISLSTARSWLHREGFRYTEHKKALYYDGHERPDVVDYRQNVFLPFMEKIRPRLVEYVVGDVAQEVAKTGQPGWNCVERRVVLVAQDEMTAQANNDKGRGWVFDGEQPIKKKGVGRGLHQSDVICSVVGHLTDASQSLEYGKNYDGYWNGELFVKQVRILAFSELWH